MEMLRDSSIGHVARFLSKDKILSYTGELEKFQEALRKSETTEEPTNDKEIKDLHSKSDTEGDTDAKSSSEGDIESANSIKLEKTKSSALHTTRTSDGIILIGWYSDDDAENPLNWSTLKQYSVGSLICVYSFSVYLGASIYSPGLQDVMQEFGVGQTAASLGMALYVLAYGIGPMIFSPLSEIPAIGRTTPYIITFTIFVILLIPTALVQNFAGLLVLRFLLGFFGSPCLATTGASFQDIFPGHKVPYMVAAWAALVGCGPSLGPLLGGYSVPVYGWRWTQWELLWLGGPTLILMWFALPETSASTILLRRAKRLRKATGNQSMKAQSEIDQKSLTVKSLAFDALIKPWEINALDPAVLFTTFFAGLVYGLFYTYFEVFPKVYGDIYHFGLGDLGLTFLSVLTGMLIAMPLYLGYWRFVVERKVEHGGISSPELFLTASVWVCWLLPAGLFIFAFTSRKSIHWIVSLIGVCITASSIFALMQCLLLYVSFCYVKYAASLLAANALSRSIFASAAILFAPFMFDAMGVAGGVSFLAGLTILCCGGLIFLFFHGARLRARSKFAVK